MIRWWHLGDKLRYWWRRVHSRCVQCARWVAPYDPNDPYSHHPSKHSCRWCNKANMHGTIYGMSGPALRGELRGRR